MSDARHKCPANGCTTMVPYHLLMCSAHWARVPAELQRVVYSTWNRCGGDFTEPEYAKARQAAIDAVNSRAPAARVSDLPASKHGTPKNMGVCLKCRAEVLWVITHVKPGSKPGEPTRGGKPMPVDPDTDDSHFATCPNADEFRRSR